MVEREIKHLHVELTPGEKKILVGFRGSKSWKDWLMSVGQLLRDAADAKEKAELRVELAHRDIKDLQERCKKLQKELEEYDRQKDHPD